MKDIGPLKQKIYWRGLAAERAVASLFYSYGHDVTVMPRNHPFDLLLNGKVRIDVKNARYSRGYRKFHITFRRPSKRDKYHTDYYIVRLEKVPGFKQSIYLAFRAPVRVLGIGLSFRALLYKYGENARLYETLRGSRLRSCHHASPTRSSTTTSRPAGCSSTQIRTKQT